jgi:hypothetical protein
MGRGYTKLPGNLNVAAARTPHLVACGTNQGLEGVVTRLAIIFIERHGWKNASKFSIIALMWIAYHSERSKTKIE